jgi:hypothetical protein
VIFRYLTSAALKMVGTDDLECFRVEAATEKRSGSA